MNMCAGMFDKYILNICKMSLHKRLRPYLKQSAYDGVCRHAPTRSSTSQTRSAQRQRSNGPSHRVPCWWRTPEQVQSVCLPCHVSQFTVHPLGGSVFSLYVQQLFLHLYKEVILFELGGGGGEGMWMCSIWFLVVSFRYALICQQCFSHNGMALKEEFEYLGKKRRAALYFRT